MASAVKKGLQVDGRERAFVHETDLSVGGFERDGLLGRETGDVHLGALAELRSWRSRRTWTPTRHSRRRLW